MLWEVLDLKLVNYLASLVNIYVLIFYARFSFMISQSTHKRVKYIDNG